MTDYLDYLREPTLERSTGLSRTPRGRPKGTKNKPKDPDATPRTKLPSLSETGHSLKYIPPGHPKNPSQSWLLPTPNEIVSDIEKCGGNLEVFLAAACKREDLRDRLMYEVLKKLKSDPFRYGEYISIVNTGQEAQQARISMRVLEAIEQNLTSKNPSAAIIGFVMKQSAKNAENSQQTSSAQSYLNVFGGDAQKG